MPTDLKGEQTSPIFCGLGKWNWEEFVYLPKAHSNAAAWLGAEARWPDPGRYHVVLHSVRAFLFTHIQVREESQTWELPAQCPILYSSGEVAAYFIKLLIILCILPYSSVYPQENTGRQRSLITGQLCVFPVVKASCVPGPVIYKPSKLCLCALQIKITSDSLFFIVCQKNYSPLLLLLQVRATRLFSLFSGVWRFIVFSDLVEQDL